MTKKGLLAGLVSLSMMVGLVFPGINVKAAETKELDEGQYQAVLDITDWNETEEVSTGLKISQRACVVKTSGMNILQVRVTGYSQYDAIYMAKQDDTKIKEIDLSKGGKIGEWKDITNYDALKEAGLVDEELNDSFIKLTPDYVDEQLDTAIFSLNSYSGYSFDCMKKLD